MTPDTTAFWREAFTRCDRLDSLELLYRSWWQIDRDGMSLADQQAVTQAKDLRKGQLQPREKAA